MSSQRIIAMKAQIFLLFLLMNFTPIQCDTSAVSISITSNHPSDTSGLPLTSTYITSPTTQFTSMYSSTYITSPTTPVSSSYMTSPTSQLSPISTMNPSTYMTSSNVQSSYTAVTTQQNNITYDLIFQFTVLSPVGLMTGNFTNTTILNSVQMMIRSVFSNLTNFVITVRRVEIKSPAKSTSYQMLTDNQFQTNDNSCPITCIINAASKSTPTQTFQLSASDNTLANVSAQSAAAYVSETSSTTTIMPTNYPNGESPPGRAAQLGMGLGISFLAVIIIAEVIILYWKFGKAKPHRQSLYEMSTSDHQFST